MMTKADCAAYCAEQGMADEAVAELLMKLFGAAHEEMHAANPELAEDAESVDPTIDGDAAVEEEEEKAKPEALLGEIARLKASLIKERKGNALTAVTADLKGRKLSDATKSKLVEAYLGDKVGYRAMVQDLGGAVMTAKPTVVTAARTSAPMAPGVGGLNASLAECLVNPSRFGDLTEDAQWGMIVDLAERENCDAWLAASWLGTGKMPQTIVELRNNRSFSAKR